MKRLWPILAFAALLAIGALLALSSRLLPIPVLAVLAWAAFRRPVWATPGRLVAIVALFVGLVWLPVDATLSNRPGAPHFVKCCCCAPYRADSLDSVLADSESGKCVFCSDLIVGMEPTWYLVW